MGPGPALMTTEYPFEAAISLPFSFFWNPPSGVTECSTLVRFTQVTLSPDLIVTLAGLKLNGTLDPSPMIAIIAAAWAWTGTKLNDMPPRTKHRGIRPGTAIFPATSGNDAITTASH